MRHETAAWREYAVCEGQHAPSTYDQPPHRRERLLRLSHRSRERAPCALPPEHAQKCFRGPDLAAAAHEGDELNAPHGTVVVHIRLRHGGLQSCRGDVDAQRRAECTRSL